MSIFQENTMDDNKEDFSITMSQLVQRYFRKKSIENEETEKNVIQKELAELRSLLREALSPA